MDYSKQVPAAERTLLLLETLAAAPDGLTAGELLDALDLSRSTLFALLNTLKARNYVEQPADRGRYRLGPALWSLIPGRSPGLGPLIEAFHADADAGAHLESLALLWLDRDETAVLAQRDGSHSVRVVHQPGERRRAVETAGGLVLLAGLGPQALERVAPADVGGWDTRLQAVRESGLAETRGADAVDLAAPVCADGAQPTAALQFSIPAYRYSPETAVALTSTLRHTAARLSYRLGAPVYQPYGWAVGEPIGPTRELDTAEISAFLQGPWGARLACVRRDGAPHVVPLWYEWDGRFVWVVATPGASWKTYAAESGQVSLTIDEPWPPLRRAFIAGHAEQVSDTAVPGGLAGLRRRLAARYLGQGAENRPEFQQTSGWSALRILPQKIRGRQGLGGTA